MKVVGDRLRGRNGDDEDMQQAGQLLSLPRENDVCWKDLVGSR